MIHSEPLMTCINYYDRSWKQMVTLLRHNFCAFLYMPMSYGSAWWRHQMETFSALLAICAGNSPVNGEFSAQRSVTRMFSLIGVWINDWVSNREAGDLRRYRAHYDVTVMEMISPRDVSMHDPKALNYSSWNKWNWCYNMHLLRSMVLKLNMFTVG